jgi:hypothetical protein
MFGTSQLDRLCRYPEIMWAKPASDRWISLCDALRQYDAPLGRLVLPRERKWELVSALQKSIRRGEKDVALRLVSAIMPEEYAYFGRRVCVIACEDVGPADDVLTSFVVACATVFPPKATGSQNHGLFSFLAEQMCDLPTRSRIYCSCGIEPAVSKSDSLGLQAQDPLIVAAILRQTAVVQFPDSPWREWQRRNDWRTAGLLRFVGLRLPMQMTKLDAPVPPYKMLFDLPSYCYDMYTRVGLEVLRRLVRGVEGADGIKEVFQRNSVTAPHRALGEALFFVEGGRIEGELAYEGLCALEQRFFAHQFRMPLDEWWQLRVLVEKALESGIINRVRDEVLRRYYGQRKLQLIAQTGGTSCDTSN